MEEPISSVNNENVNLIWKLLESWCHFRHSFKLRHIHNSNVSLDKWASRRATISFSCLPSAVSRHLLKNIIYYFVVFPASFVTNKLLSSQST
jgi:hypothetical protein